jgi:transcriptional regulator with XRE-family HTH domain
MQCQQPIVEIKSWIMRVMGRTREKEKGSHQEFGKRLVSAIDARGWSELSQLALGRKLTGVTGATVNNWINGYKLPSTETAIELAVILNVSLDWLLVGRGAMHHPPIQEQMLYIGDVPEEAQTAIKGLIKSFRRD